MFVGKFGSGNIKDFFNIMLLFFLNNNNLKLILEFVRKINVCFFL